MAKRIHKYTVRLTDKANDAFNKLTQDEDKTKGDQFNDFLEFINDRVVVLKEDEIDLLQRYMNIIDPIQHIEDYVYNLVLDAKNNEQKFLMRQRLESHENTSFHGVPERKAEVEYQPLEFRQIYDC
ncbi:hypothetical protein CKO50_20410 [Pseudoalteromonas sp. HM-SA03]|uniref:hypothetical protein n=1 Tax=Pseudoalteromonas sp. HM-SA03 TaxID=2029678 RepID=UPI000BADF1C0|nr:hypothetical protein [Pseudoalteromonas sp. HM-SA03]PAX99577.1 hypothetical protein CKO50_20410 [Pseudoalteromonas sp. HM-SA03]